MFEMFKIDEGHQRSIGVLPTLDAAVTRIFDLAEFWPADYAILDQVTGELSTFPAGRLAVGTELLRDSPGERCKPVLKKATA